MQYETLDVILSNKRMTSQQFATLRKLLKLTQAEMADAIGVSQGAISQYEAGMTKIKGSTEKLLQIKYYDQYKEAIKK